MALRLSKTFHTTPELWLNLQQFYDLWHATYDSKAWQGARALTGGKSAASTARS
jgi:plasmid maintenance system antidote protein VapI